ncbi:unnamed protein product [Linum tenue]|uniref:Uncharacterized protein n=1 Tax=Linum tenue TaxID=586396 RepID=A0AAV0IIB7_9ROSI|nr:unnamed protein product [Linum tenue]
MISSDADSSFEVREILVFFDSSGSVPRIRTRGSSAMDEDKGMFNVQQTIGTVLCCRCGIRMQPNAANMCVRCLRSDAGRLRGEGFPIDEGIGSQIGRGDDRVAAAAGGAGDYRGDGDGHHPGQFLHPECLAAEQRINSLRSAVEIGAAAFVSRGACSGGGAAAALRGTVFRRASGIPPPPAAYVVVGGSNRGGSAERQRRR